MRSLVILLTTVTLSLTGLSGQHSKGSLLLSGNFQLEPQAGPGIMGINFSPTLHYFLNDHLTLGGSISLGATFEKGVQLLVLDPEGRYYFHASRSRNSGFLFVQPQLFFPYDEEFGQENHVSLLVGGGLQTLLTPNVALENKLSVLYNDRLSRGSTFLSSPSFIIQTGILLYLDYVDKWDVRPGVGRGSWMIGGTNAAMSYRSNRQFRQFALNLLPRAGYFLTDKFVVGLGLPFHFSFLDFKGVTSIFRAQSNYLGLAPFIRFFPGQWGSRALPFVDLDLTYLRNRVDDSSSSHLFGTPRHTYRVNFNAGIDYFITSTAALEAGLFFSWLDHMEETRMGIRVGFQFFLTRERE